MSYFIKIYKEAYILFLDALDRAKNNKDFELMLKYRLTSKK